MKQMSEHKLRNDIILASALLLIAALAYSIIHSVMHKGSLAIVSIDGVDVAEYRLDEDIEIEIPIENGHSNTLTIKDGKAFITYADCPDKLCVKRGGIHLTGQTIVCLPHKLVVRIEGEGGGVDAG